MIRNRIARIAAAVVFALVFTGIGYGIAVANQPHMVNARGYLNSALSELESAQANKGGYRDQAIGYVKQAIGSVNSGIAYYNTH